MPMLLLILILLAGSTMSQVDLLAGSTMSQEDLLGGAEKLEMVVKEVEQGQDGLALFYLDAVLSDRECVEDVHQVIESGTQLAEKAGEAIKEVETLISELRGEKRIELERITDLVVEVANILMRTRSQFSLLTGLSPSCDSAPDSPFLALMDLSVLAREVGEFVGFNITQEDRTDIRTFSDSVKTIETSLRTLYSNKSLSAVVRTFSNLKMIYETLEDPEQAARVEEWSGVIKEMLENLVQYDCETPTCKTCRRDCDGCKKCNLCTTFCKKPYSGLCSQCTFCEGGPDECQLQCEAGKEGEECSECLQQCPVLPK